MADGTTLFADTGRNSKNEHYYFDTLLQQKVINARDGNTHTYAGNYSKLVIGSNKGANLNAAGNFKLVANFPNETYGEFKVPPNYLRDIIGDKSSSIENTWIQTFYDLTQKDNWICTNNEMGNMYQSYYNDPNYKFFGLVESRTEENLNMSKLMNVVTHMSTKINELIHYVLEYNINAKNL